tara:strand:- start:904 stop:1029 length:126 start_codon:yes stop_codon:yes gene_type:complete
MVLSEKWYIEHMGVMAAQRTVMAMVNLFLTTLIVLKVFELI